MLSHVELSYVHDRTILINAQYSPLNDIIILYHALYYKQNAAVFSFGSLLL